MRIGNEAPRIEVTGIDTTPELLCPRCGSNYLHHEKVHIFARTEDAPVKMVSLDAYDGLITWPGIYTTPGACPSDRRHGVTIEFSCEECTGPVFLHLAQHKGNTFVTTSYPGEKVPDTLVDMVRVGNPGEPDIEITSRYNKSDEFVTMAVAVLRMPDELRRVLRTVFCDSKATACYTLTCATYGKDEIRRIAEGFAARLPGHNGIWAKCHDEESPDLTAELDPDWRET